VTDAAASVFAAELITAYPHAKVILNYREDLDDWHRSVTETLARANHHWPLWALSRLSRECFWAWQVYVRFMWPGLFRALDGNIETGMARNGKWVYRGKRLGVVFPGHYVVSCQIGRLTLSNRAQQYDPRTCAQGQIAGMDGP
jgi:hypothetical protein